MTTSSGASVVGGVGPATVFIDTGASAGSGIVDVPSTTLLEAAVPLDT